GSRGRHGRHERGPARGRVDRRWPDLARGETRRSRSWPLCMAAVRLSREARARKLPARLACAGFEVRLAGGIDAGQLRWLLEQRLARACVQRDGCMRGLLFCAAMAASLPAFADEEGKRLFTVGAVPACQLCHSLKDAG